MEKWDKEEFDQLEHAICMGIRNGLFGTSEVQDLGRYLPDYENVAEALNNISSSIDKLADVLDKSYVLGGSLDNIAGAIKQGGKS